MKAMLVPALVCIGLALASPLSAAELPPPASRKIDFRKDVQPILRRACYECHGPEKEKSGYRLDVRSVALTGGEAYAPNIVAGKSADSPLITFVAGAGDLLMPPEDKPRLSAEEIGILRAWIDQGASWPDEVAGKVEDKSDWWSLQPLVPPAVPQVADPAMQNPVDAFIRDRLAREKFTPSPEADRRTLIRRVSFDLLGLPPTPEEIAAFVADSEPLAYERLVDRLLASPHYGERWARHWMDAIHFAETHGHDQDRIRENAWPYRDYLIASFNADKPLSRFVEEQVAGDALYPHDPQATIALGFLAAGPWDESSLRDIREDTLDRQIGRYLDRDDMIGTVMHNLTSMTVQCARCHDHKFDPISQADYYALQAVFAGVERANRKFDADPAVARQRDDLERRAKLLEQKDPARIVELLAANMQPQIAAWEKSLAAKHTEWKILPVQAATSSDGSTLTPLEDGSVRSEGKRPDRDTYTLVAEVAPGEITAVRIEVLTDDALPHRGPGRQDNGNLHLSEFQLFLEGQAAPLALAHPTSDFDQQDWGIAKALDGNPQTAWGIYPQVGQAHRAAFELQKPLALSQPGKLRFVLQQLHGDGHLIGRVRIAVTSAPQPVRVDSLPESLARILAKPHNERSRDEQTEVALAYEREQIERGQAKLPPPLVVYAAASDFEPDGGLRPPPGPRPIHLLHRGDIRHPREEAKPGALSCLPQLPARFKIDNPGDESARRAALAHWLTHPDNPLIWRSMANRVWHHHFGRGLSSTLNDFGHLGEKPSHPELLDWLAAELREGQSLKVLHRLLVTSVTYRQTSRIVAHQQGKHSPTKFDTDNRLLWRMNRTRLDAECVRDALLLASGRLDERMGGPSDRQFDLQPGIHVTPRVDYTKFDVDSAAGRRRSVYRFLFRTLPDPWMEALDCPSGDQFMPVRTNSVTVQQALALWNDEFVLRHCEHLAARVQAEAGTLEEQTVRAVQHTFGRTPTEAEQQQLADYARKHGLANLCRVLVNSNEFMYVD